VGFGVGHALIQKLQGHDVELDVGRGRVRRDAREAAGLGEVRRERAGLRGFVLV
jgi:hypothetical protein